MIVITILLLNLSMFLFNAEDQGTESWEQDILDQLKQNLCCNMDYVDFSLDPDNKHILVMARDRNTVCTTNRRRNVVHTETRLDLSQMKRWWFFGFNFSKRATSDGSIALSFHGNDDFTSDQLHLRSLASTYKLKRIGSDGLEIVGVERQQHLEQLAQLEDRGVTSYKIGQYCDNSYTIGPHFSRYNPALYAHPGKEDIVIELLEELYSGAK